MAVRRLADRQCGRQRKQELPPPQQGTQRCHTVTSRMWVMISSTGGDIGEGEQRQCRQPPLLMFAEYGYRKIPTQRHSRRERNTRASLMPLQLSTPKTSVGARDISGRPRATPAAYTRATNGWRRAGSHAVGAGLQPAQNRGRLPQLPLQPSMLNSSAQQVAGALISPIRLVIRHTARRIDPPEADKPGCAPEIATSAGWPTGNHNRASHSVIRPSTSCHLCPGMHSG
jgi:hypothetical protein